MLGHLPRVSKIKGVFRWKGSKGVREGGEEGYKKAPARASGLCGSLRIIDSC